MSSETLLICVYGRKRHNPCNPCKRIIPSSKGQDYGFRQTGLRHYAWINDSLATEESFKWSIVSGTIKFRIWKNALKNSLIPCNVAANSYWSRKYQ
jgi:hypothetical protein